MEVGAVNSSYKDMVPSRKTSYNMLTIFSIRREKTDIQSD